MQPKAKTLARSNLKYRWIIFKRHWGLYLILLIPIIYIIIYKYWPMIGVQIAFKQYNPAEGFFGGEWIGFDNFIRYFTSHTFVRTVRNTLTISISMLFFSLPFSILFAISLNEIRVNRLKKTIQLVTYMPHFISIVVLVSMMNQLLSPHSGILNHLITLLGGEPVNFMGDPDYFQAVYVISGIWQTTGYSSIIFIAALTSIDQTLYEAAAIDGASKVRKIWHIDIPCILPTIVTVFILNAGRLMTVGHEKVYLMQNNANMETAELISTYVYKTGLLQGDYAYATAIGLFNSVVNLILIFSANSLAKRFSDSSIF